MDNHDVARFLFGALGDVPALRNALTLLLTEEGLPCLYYGTELDFAGGNDPANREVLWTTGFPTTGDTFRHIAKILKVRKAVPALRRGDTRVLWSTAHTAAEEDAGIIAYERGGGDATDSYAMVVLNTNSGKASSTSDGSSVMKTGKASAKLVDVLDPGRAVFTTASDGTLKVSVPAQSARLLLLESEATALGI